MAPGFVSWVDPNILGTSGWPGSGEAQNVGRVWQYRKSIRTLDFSTEKSIEIQWTGDQPNSNWDNWDNWCKLHRISDP